MSASAIIPVFNEAKTVTNVIERLLTSPLIDEVICVNDGSKDKTLAVLKSFGKKIRIVNLAKNHGKGYALAQGVKKAKGEIVVFFDADLIHFSKKHIETLLAPMSKNGIRAVLGYSMPRKNHFFASSFWSVNVTGQRAYYRKDLLIHLKEMAKTKYGVEIFLNSLFKQKEVKKVPLLKLTHVWTHRKYKPHQALKQYFRLGTQIAREVGKVKFKEYSKLTKDKGNDGYKLIKKEINNRLLENGFNPLFYWSLFNYYYKKIDFKSLSNFLFEK